MEQTAQRVKWFDFPWHRCSHPQAKCTFATELETIAYENFIKTEVFDFVLNNQKNLKVPYENCLSGIGKMSQILQAQNNYLQYGIFQVAPPYDIFLQAYAESNGESELLGKFIQVR